MRKAEGGTCSRGTRVPRAKASLQGEVRVHKAKRGGAMWRRRELLEGRDTSRLGFLGCGSVCGWWRVLWFRRGASWERGSPPPGYSRSHTLGGPAVRCEQAPNGGREGGVPLSADARTQTCPWCSRASTCPLSSQRKSRNSKFEEGETKATPFQPPLEMSCSPDTFFPNVKTNPCFLPHELCAL